MAKYNFYPYDPINKEKYKGNLPLIFRSSWELEFARHCDLLPHVVEWNYEAVSIPYKDPITGKQKIYIPDFFVSIAQKDGYTIEYIFEIKPRHEQQQEFARNTRDSALVARNSAKWMAASRWADRHMAQFQVLNEADLYSFHENKNPRKNPIKGFAHTNTTNKPKAVTTKKMITKSNKPTPQRNIQSRVSGIGRISRVSRVR